MSITLLGTDSNIDLDVLAFLKLANNWNFEKSNIFVYLFWIVILWW